MAQSINPTTGETISSYKQHSPESVRRAIDASAAIQEEWAHVILAARAVHMRDLADILTRRRQELAELMALEMGKPVTQGLAEADKCAWVCNFYADGAQRMLDDLPIETGRSKSYVAYRPLGVILAVMPWNFPFWQVFRFLAPALMAGNGGILKHSSNVTGAALKIDEMVVQAGFPDGLFRTVVLPADRVTEVLDHPKIVAATLTGSDAAGRAIATQAGGLLKKTLLELGGSDPYLVLHDADVDLAVDVCATGRMLNGGQSCIAAKRFIVHMSILEEFTAKLTTAMGGAVMGDPMLATTTLGPLARHDLRDELHGQVVRSVDAGARLVLGGVIPDGPGAFYPPTILADVLPGMAVFSEETFGPVAGITSFDDEEHAVILANDSEFGLGAAVFTKDVVRGERMARDQLEAGACFVNAIVASDPRLPFGGIKASGYGRELATIGMHEFLNIKTVVVG